MLTVRCTAPAADVVAVEVAHFAGGRPRTPQFALHPDRAGTVRTEVDDRQASLTSGALTARFAARTASAGVPGPTGGC
jgi:alpha-D-xyloside xylohydrolase